MISAIDDGVGKIVATLRERELEESTLLFFIGDNGAPLKIHKLDSPLDGDAGGWDGSLNTPLNGEKGMLTEGGIRVPWLASWKGRIPPGQVYQHPVISLDVAATALAAAELPSDSTLDGVNLVPHLAGEVPDPPHRHLTWRWIAQAAIREGNWKLLVGGSRSYLFDLQADPQEKQDLRTRHPEIAARLRAQLESWSAELQPPGMATQPMSAVWENYYDYYLDGKPALGPTSANPRSAGWIVRNAKFEVQQGVLRIISESESRQRPFIGFNGLRIPGPAIATTSVQAEQGGKLGIAWRLDGQRDFPPSQVVYQNLFASPEFQVVSVDLAAAGRIVHVRLLLPEGASGVKQFELKSSQGNAKRQWRFD
jgi:uncharacterized sulfatase